MLYKTTFLQTDYTTSSDDGCFLKFCISVNKKGDTLKHT